MNSRKTRQQFYYAQKHETDSIHFSHSIQLAHVHCVQKQTSTHIFDYNSGVSLSIYILFVPMETGMNTLKYTYLLVDDVITASHRKSQKFTSQSNDEHWTTLLNFRFDYNSGVSRLIFFILFELVEIGINTIQSSQHNLQITLTESPVSTLPNVKTAHFENTVVDRFGSAFDFDRTGCLQLSQKAV